MLRSLIAGAIALALISPAQAKRHHPNHQWIRCGGFSCSNPLPEKPADWKKGWTKRSDGRPSRWCGWYARHYLVSSDPGPSYNLARNWAHWGHSASPGTGVIVVWPHHVGMITGRAENGQWIVKSGNDGHAVRERPRSLAGAIAFREG